MSNSNRTPSRSPGPQIARYLHRIEQIVGTRNRTPSPISSRISRPLRPNSLDHYLKYELTLKIICGFFDKSHKACMRHFFNCFRNIAISKIEKIYRFVPIERTECSHMVVDSGISTKMLINIIKIKLKDHLRLGFDSIRSISTVEFAPKNSYTARSNMSVIFPLTISDKKKSLITIVLQNIYVKRKCSIFYMIKVECCKKEGIKEKKKQEFFLLETELKLFNTILQKLKSKNMNQAFTFILLYQKESEEKPQSETQNKCEQLVFFSNILLTKSIIKSFTSLKESIYFLNHQKNNEKILQLAHLKKELEAQAIAQIKAIDLAKEQMEAQSLALEEAEAAIMENSNVRIENDFVGSIYHATSKINTALISWLIRTKMEVFRILEAIKNEKYEACIAMRNILYVKFVHVQSSSFHKILEEAVLAKMMVNTKSTSPSIREQPLTLNWKAISCLVKIGNYFTYALSPSFHAIMIFAKQQSCHEGSLKKIESIMIKISLRDYFGEIKKHSIHQNAIQIELQKIQESSEQSLKDKEFLVKVLFKMATFSITSAFMEQEFDLENENFMKNIQKLQQKKTSQDGSKMYKFSYKKENDLQEIQYKNLKREKL